MDFYFVKHGLVDGKYSIEIKELQKIGNDTTKIDMKAVQENWALLQTKYNKDKSGFQGLDKAEIKQIFGANFTEYEPDFYYMAKEKFRNPWYVALYVVLICALGFHLNHALQSLFQTFGLNHRKYTKFVKLFSTLYALLIVGIFSIIPVWIYFFDVLLPMLKA